MDQVLTRLRSWNIDAVALAWVSRASGPAR